LINGWQVAAVLAGLLAGFSASSQLVRMQRRHAQLRRRYLARGRRLLVSLRMVRLAEDLASLGLWQLDLRSGRQRWSSGLYALLGLEESGPLQPGDAETLLDEGGRELARKIAQHGARHDSFAIDFGARRVDGEHRAFRLHARNRFGPDGALRAIYGVVMDVTDQAKRETALRESETLARQEALAASRLAETDPLTGLANRRAVMDWLDRAICRARTGGATISLVALDIDHFKSINDRFGHPAGDRVLQQVAAIARQQTRDGDLVGRMGGEEFIIGLRDAGAAVALARAERLRAAIARQSGLAGVPPVTASIGYATHEPGDTSLTLFGRADAALYAAKQGGRNRVRPAA